MSAKTAAKTGDKKKTSASPVGAAEERASKAAAGNGEPKGPDVEEFEALKDRYARLSADFENYRKRLAKEKREILDFGNAEKLKDLLSVVDNMERAIGLSERTEKVEEGAAEAFLEGIKLVRSQLLAALRNFGVTVIDAAPGTDFDPNYHEAVYKEYSETHGDGTIIAESQKGYLLNGRLLRPSMVSVSRGSEKASGESSEEEN